MAHRCTITNWPAHALSPQAETREIVIDGFEFCPARLTVPQGASIVWINREPKETHSLSLIEPHEEVWTVDMLPGEEFEREFAEVGTFNYYCSIYNFMLVRLPRSRAFPATLGSSFVLSCAGHCQGRASGRSVSERFRSRRERRSRRPSGQCGLRWQPPQRTRRPSA